MKLLVSMLFALCLWPRTAHADDLRAAAEQAHRLGRYGFAVRAFQSLHQQSSEPALLLSIAKAYHQRHLAEGGVFAHARAIAFYRRYLAAAPRGTKRNDADAALRELGEPMATPELIAAGLAAERNKTLIAIRSPVLSASLRIDGGPKRDLPRFVELGAGAHVLVVTAPDHLRKKRRVVLERGAVRALDIALEPEPAELALSTSVGAEVHIDGEFVGVAPFDDNIAVEPGTRRIRVTLTGHHVAEREIVVTRGVVTEVTIELAATHQRIAAGLLIGAGALAVTGAIVLGIGSTIHDQDAGDASDESDSAELGRQAEEWRILSGITAATGFGFFLAGGTLFIFDEPDVRLEARGSSLWLRGRF